MLLVDRKVSLPGDFDIQVAYIYPIAIASAAVEMSDDEEVSYFSFILWYEVLFIQMKCYALFRNMFCLLSNRTNKIQGKVVKKSTKNIQELIARKGYMNVRCMVPKIDITPKRNRL